MTARDEEALAPEPVRVDARGLKCPWPVLRAARAMREHEAVRLLADDPVALIDIPALAEANGWSLHMRDHAAHTEFQLRRATMAPGKSGS